MPYIGKYIFTFVVLNIVYAVYAGNVFLETDGNIATITNDLVKISFTENASIYSLIRDGKDLLGTVEQRTFYFDWNAGGGKFQPSNLTIVTNTSDLVHIMYYQPVGHRRLEMEYHVAVFSNTSGFYQWMKASNTGNVTIEMAEFRMVYRLSRSLLTQMSNGARSGESPRSISANPTIQDTTWQLKDGSYWSKYDYAGYIRETPWFGLYGEGVGSWVVSASREYHSGGPLKQDLLTQHDSLMCHYLTGSHFGTPIFYGKPGWSKFYGPWLLYVSAGSDEDMLADVEKQTEIEKSNWPYNWIEDPQYSFERGTLTGQVDEEGRAAVILYDSFAEEFDQQTNGYLYNTETDDNGFFTIANIRPGIYSLVLYPLSGHGSDTLVTKNITITPGTQDAGTLELPEVTNILWHIGETSRRSDSFRYSDEPRNFYWHTLPPANLTYTIGKSTGEKDWYYAQTRNGTWNIIFDDAPDTQDRVLRVSMAAASGSLIFNVTTARLQVSVNGDVVGEFEYENDKAIYRDALQSGNFHAEKIVVDAAKVVDGQNKVSLTILNGMVMYDAISYQTLGKVDAGKQNVSNVMV